MWFQLRSKRLNQGLEMIKPDELFALLSDETRLRCLFLLYKEKELCVCEFGAVLESIQPKISRHLAYLRRSGLVLDERRGQWVYYKLNELPKGTEKILLTILNVLTNLEPYKSDLEKINKLKKKSICC